MRKIPIFVAALSLASFASTPAAAQWVRGELVERSAQRPIGGAMVILLDAAGARMSSTLTDAGGRFELRAPAPGTYTVRAERVGFRSSTSAPMTLAADEVRTFRMEGDPAAVSLAGITATGGARRCRARPGVGEATAVLWEEARKALAATAAAERAMMLRYDVELYGRDLAAGSLTVMAENRRKQSGLARSPFRSRGLDTLSAMGYVREEGDSVAFDAPDAHVLLSNQFVADHCFRVQEEGAEPGMIGLAFEPVSQRRLPDVAGVLWIDRQTAELRRLDYGYVNLPRHITEHAGGRVEFQRLPAGAWVVNRWYIRMPMFEETRRFESVGDDMVRVRGRVSNRLVAIREEGGEIVGSSLREWRAPARSGRVAGIVWDSLMVRPLAGAQVFLSGTSHTATSDSVGRFAIENVPAGRYSVIFMHPSLADWGAVSNSAAVEVPSTDDRPVVVASPSLETLVARVCQPGDLRTHPGVVMGTVTRQGRPQEKAKVEMTWRALNPRTETVMDTGLEVETDGRGFYAVCGVPTDVQLAVEVTPAGAESPAFRDRLNLLGEKFARKDMALAGITRVQQE